MAFAEDIRLVIWDLDQTFWDGTLLEGGICYRADNHELVVDLARRGIMSAICSKNDIDQTRPVLRDHGIWEFFIFPSIDWTPKGPRIREMLRTIGLRPPSALFIDDNPTNLHEALHAVPGLNIVGPEVIETLRGHPRLAGRSDASLSRLKSYRAKAARRRAECRSGEDEPAFLRASNLRVYLDYDVERHIDRVIELVNRTNQLNFTKRRLPEDAGAARAELLVALRHNTTDAALIRVVDKFGDHGFAGFYLTRRINNKRRLEHFCFSCRILSLCVEHWLYRFLDRPQLEVAGEVLSDVKDDAVTVDWITPGYIADAGVKQPATVERFDRIFARGGCDLASLMHYFALHSDTIVEEFNAPKNGQTLRRDHSCFLLPALGGGLNAGQLTAAAGLGYGPEDFQTRLHDRAPGPELYVLSFWADADIPVYRHRASGLRVPYWLPGALSHDLTARPDICGRIAGNDRQRGRLAYLRENFDCEGLPNAAQMLHRFRAVLATLPRDQRAVVILANERGPAYFQARGAGTAHPRRHPVHAHLNVALRAAAKDLPHVELFDPESVIDGEEDLIDINHFRRDVYHAIYRSLMHGRAERA